MMVFLIHIPTERNGNTILAGLALSFLLALSMLLCIRPEPLRPITPQDSDYSTLSETNRRPNGIITDILADPLGGS